jgi:elongation factor G
MDRMGSDFFQVLEDIKTKLGAQAVPIQLPIAGKALLKG